VKSIERLGTFEDLLAGQPEPVVVLARHLRALVAEVHPDAVEVPRRNEGTACYGWGERKMSESYTYLAPQRGWVNLGFFRGTDLPDPQGLLEGTGARMRHVKVRPDAFDPAPLRELLVAAREERRAALGR
jgi:hypothetical protein